MTFRLLLYLVPIALTVLNQCKQLGIRPYLPVLGLAIGIAAEMSRRGT